MSREPYEEILRRNLTRTLQGNAPQHPIPPRGLAGQDLCWQRLRGHRQSARNRVTMLCVKEVRASTRRSYQVEGARVQFERDFDRTVVPADRYITGSLDRPGATRPMRSRKESVPCDCDACSA